MLHGVVLEKTSFASEEEYNKSREFIVEHIYKTICENPESIPLFKDDAVRDKSEFYDFYDFVVMNEREWACFWILVAFYEDVSPVTPEGVPRKEAVGVALFNTYTPWYSHKKILQEMLTVSFKKHCGLAAAVADWMEDWARKNFFNLIGAACANTPYSEMVANTYKKKGFTVYPTFYKEIK